MESISMSRGTWRQNVERIIDHVARTTQKQLCRENSGTMSKCHVVNSPTLCTQNSGRSRILLAWSYSLHFHSEKSDRHTQGEVQMNQGKCLVPTRVGPAMCSAVQNVILSERGWEKENTLPCFGHKRELISLRDERVHYSFAFMLH